MTLFPLTPPRLGLSITTDSACLVEIQRTWREKVFRELTLQPLPANLIQLSPTKPNISDTKALGEALAKLSKRFKKPQPIVLSLPDICGRTALFEFTAFPKKPADQEAILSWRFQKDLNLSTKNARIGFKVFAPQSGKSMTSAPDSAVTRVLATTFQETVIGQYELACLEAGLLPLEVGLASLDVFDFCRLMIQGSDPSTSQQNFGSSLDSFFLYLAGWGFSFIAFRNNYPVFVRVKSLRLHRSQEPHVHAEGASLGEENSMTLSESTQVTDTTTPPGDPPPIEQDTLSTKDAARMVTNELVATLQYYLESFPSSTREGKTLPLFFAEGLERGTTFLSEIQEIESMLKSSMVDPPSLTLIPLPDRLRKSLPSKLASTPHTHPRAVPAYASVMVAS